MTKAILDFFEQLHRDPELKSELDKILAQYPEEDILCEYCFDDQVKFIYEVILPFAEEHGFEFCLEDIVQGSGESTLDDKYLEQVAGGINLGRKLSVGTLAAFQTLALVSPVQAAATADASFQISESYTSVSKQSMEDDDYGNVIEVFEDKHKELQPISNEYPLNEVDGMIFATLSYMPMDCVPNLDSDITDKEITISQWYERLLKYFDESDEKLTLHSEDEHNTEKYGKRNLTEKDIMRRGRIRLMNSLSKSPRYMNIKVGNFRGKYSDVSNKDYEQFAAVTFTLEDGTKVVAYRGTDSTLSGWKEDLDLSWSKQVPAQKDALQYLEDIYNLNPDSNFVVTGHSKGGHLSLYSSFYMCSKNNEFADRLKSILNYDGPGLRKDIVSDIDPKVFDKTSEKLITFIPQSSVIGRIMGETSKGKLVCVYSTAEEFFKQHDSLNWNIYKNCENSRIKFKCYEIQPESEFSAEAISIFLDEVNKEDAMKIFLNWAFDFMNRNNINIEDERSSTEIFKDVFYNYFIKGKSLGEIVDTVFSPGQAIGISPKEQKSFAKVMKAALTAITASYWKRHLEMNKKIGFSSEFNNSVEKMVNSGYSFGSVSRTLQTIIGNMLTLDKVWAFIKKIYA